LGRLHVRFALAGLLIFGLTLGFALFNLHLFSFFAALSNETREVWLPATQLLGDLNNDTSDYRAAEGDVLIASNERELARQAGIVAELDRAIGRELRGLNSVPRPMSARARDFESSWQAYRGVSQQVIALAASGQHDQASALYRTQSRAAYTRTSDALGALSADNQLDAQNASTRTARAYRQGLYAMRAACVAVGCLLALALYAVKRGISDPLSGLAESMRRLAANIVEIEIRSLRRGDEIGDMARAVAVFRANAVELIDSQRSLSRQAARLEQQLADEQELTRRQRNFIAMISHEFRTPLTAIDAHAQRLVNMNDRIGPADLAERAGRIRSSVQRIIGLIDNLLNSARLMDGEFGLSIEPESVDIAQLLEEVCSFAEETSPNARIVRQFGGVALPLQGDRKLLFQAFGNLVANAVKYSTGEAEVIVAADAADGCVEVRVSDRGIGISAGDQTKLFARYYRGTNVAGIVGTGVGLYLTKTVVTLHGGQISVESTEGKGSTFRVLLPQGV
jgi:signal transduction histidine kinase